MTLLLLLSCAPSITSLDGVAQALTDRAPQAEGDSLRISVEGEPWSIRAALLPDPPTLRLWTTELFRLADDASPEVTLRVLATVATLDHTLPVGRLSLDASAGEVVLSVDELVADGLSPEHVRAALRAVEGEARAVGPRLHGEASPR